MAMLYRCDGCGRDFDADEAKRHIMDVKLTVSTKGRSAETDFGGRGWVADLCRTCLGKIKKPHNWPRDGEGPKDLPAPKNGPVKTLEIDGKWSVEYSASGNACPLNWLRNGERILTSTDNLHTAMFYEILRLKGGGE